MRVGEGAPAAHMSDQASPSELFTEFLMTYYRIMVFTVFLTWLCRTSCQQDTVAHTI